MLTLALLLGLGGGGCGSMTRKQPSVADPIPQPPAAKASPADLPVPPPAKSDFVGLTRHLAATIDHAGKACARLATELDAWTAAHGDAYRAAIVKIDAWEATARREEVKTFYSDIFDDIQVRIAAGVRCDSDTGARAAFERFFEAVGFIDMRNTTPPPAAPPPRRGKPRAQRAPAAKATGR